MRSLIGRAACFAPAIAFGWTWELVAIDGKPTQFMAAAPGDPGRALPGVVWLDLSEAEAAVIDALELADGLRRKVRLDVQIGRRRLPASTFVRK
jgi:hypothetical protein